MTLDELLTATDNKSPPAPMEELERFEVTIGERLPDDYREFLIRCNGGYAGGYVSFQPTMGFFRNLWLFILDVTGIRPAGGQLDACLNHIGGFREEPYISLRSSYDNYQTEEVRIPKDLLWIADDPFGNAICLGIRGNHRGRVYFWDHEVEPDVDTWDGRLDIAGNIRPLAASFTEFVQGLRQVPMP